VTRSEFRTDSQQNLVAIEAGRTGFVHLCLFYYLLLTANGVIPGGSDTAVTHITHNTQNNTQHTKLQKQ
jgi:hypothetical protein